MYTVVHNNITLDLVYGRIYIYLVLHRPSVPRVVTTDEREREYVDGIMTMDGWTAVAEKVIDTRARSRIERDRAIRRCFVYRATVGTERRKGFSVKRCVRWVLYACA